MIGLFGRMRHPWGEANLVFSLRFVWKQISEGVARDTGILRDELLWRGNGKGEMGGGGLEIDQIFNRRHFMAWFANRVILEDVSKGQSEKPRGLTPELLSS